MAVHSVSDVTLYIKNMLAGEPLLNNLLVRGEISNFKQYPSGHVYFTLKDAGASLKCVMFRSRAQRLRFRPGDGLQVVAGGSIGVYERDGAYQLYVEDIIPDGVGALNLAFEQLKERLAAEGLFDEGHKRPLPMFPQKIGVVTSISGAVLRDIRHVAKQRNPRVQLVLLPVLVQGNEAAGQIAAAIKFFNRRYPVDILIVGRGGGSLEDLWAFNEEAVVRAVYGSRIPVISAVGHETDFTLADFVSDARAATPSHAAEMAVPDVRDLSRHLRTLQLSLGAAARRILAEKRGRLALCLSSALWRNPRRLLDNKKQRLDDALNRLLQATRDGLVRQRHYVELRLERLSLLNPARILAGGYGAVRRENKAVSSVRNLSRGDMVTTFLLDGQFTARVESIEEGGQLNAKEKGAVV